MNMSMKYACLAAASNDDVALGDLDNEIHPVFAKHNFPGVDYRVLEPVLRLASLLLSSEHLMHYWHALFLGPRRLLVHLSKKHGEPVTEFWAKRGPLSQMDVARTRLHLLRLASVIRFYRGIGSDSPRYARGSPKHLGHGSTGCSIDPSRGNLVYMGYVGVGSDIEYCDNIYEKLENAKMQSPCRILQLRFLLAVTLVHETAHAATRLLGDYAEGFFEQNVLSEAGFQWEACTFGGLVDSGYYESERFRPVDRLAWDPSDHLVLTAPPWPSRIACHSDYLESPARVDHDSLPPIELRWLVPVSFVQKLFTNHLWSVEVENKGSRALHCPKTLAFRYSIEAGQMIVPRTDDDPYWSQESCIPDGYMMGQDGIITRIAGWTDWDGFGRLLVIRVYDLEDLTCWWVDEDSFGRLLKIHVWDLARYDPYPPRGKQRDRRILSRVTRPLVRAYRFARRFVSRH